MATKFFTAAESLYKAGLEAKKLHVAHVASEKEIKELGFLPLHWGVDGFMSLKQFETFYWPELDYSGADRERPYALPLCGRDCGSRL